ncbi:hypothetical protein GN244_ATG09105 [Phytophthora infestans]|uniref:Uncharacterized protein n=1 Tax=Phytophthora infestans TaxID=4787 RepID=A0A833T7N8_PHYIN|nr:hypothetical protein GN244_ATG09105 [Phytophthora infestans]
MQVERGERQLKRQMKQQVDDVTTQRKEGSTSGSERDRLVLELQQSHAECQTHEKKLIALRDRVEELQAANKTLSEDEREARSRAVDQKLYDLEARLTTSEADKVVAHQDAERLQRDLDALEGVLHQFQVESKDQKERVARRQSCKRASLFGRTNDFERVMEKLAKKTHGECEQLRERRTRIRSATCWIKDLRLNWWYEHRPYFTKRCYHVVFLLTFDYFTTLWGFGGTKALAWGIKLKEILAGDGSRLSPGLLLPSIRRR